MSLKTSKIINYTLIVIIVGVTGIFIAKHAEMLFPKNTVVKTELRKQEPPSSNGEVIASAITAGGSLLMLLLKYFLYDRKRSKKAKPAPSFLDHPIFTVLDESLQSGIKQLYFKSPGKTAMFQLMLQEQFLIYKQLIKEAVLEIPVLQTPQEFRTWARHLLITIRDTYVERWRLHGIPEVVINSYITWHKDRFDIMLSDIDTMSFYFKPEEKYDSVISLLTALSYIIKLGLTSDSVKAISSLNGELDKLEFRGLPLC